jgi:putative tryptophan/tyrosine transport system substrate-binding protein
MPRTRPARRSEAFDPSETLRVHCGNGFDARFEPLSKHSFEPIQCCFLTLGKAMQRREFITLLGGTAAAWPLAARSQQSGRLPTIGFVGGATASAWTNWSAAFVQRLRELGWSEGRTVSIEYRWAEGRHERAAEIAAEFVRLKVDVIITSGGVLSAAKQATSTIPIVFAVANDPVGAGFVSSLARPGGNVTGLSLQTTDLAAKRLELLREIAPGIRRLGVLANFGNAAAVPEIDEVQAAARILGLEVVMEMRQAEDITSAFTAFGSGAEALYVCTDPLILAQRARINTLALAARLPTIYGPREHVEAGGLMSYGANFPAALR